MVEVTEVIAEVGIVPCGICGKWVMSNVNTQLDNRPVHPACLFKKCDFCDNPKNLTVKLYWDNDKDDNAFMCEECKSKRRISVAFRGSVV